MNQSVITVVGKDRVGIVYEVAKILAENRINIVNISQQLMGQFFTMMIVVDTEQSGKNPAQLAQMFAIEGEKLSLDIRIQHEEIFNAMHRI